MIPKLPIPIPKFTRIALLFMARAVMRNTMTYVVGGY